MWQREGQAISEHDGIKILVMNGLTRMAANVVLAHHYANQGFVKNNAHYVSASLFNIFADNAHLK